MPILHTQLTGQAQTPNGKTVPLPPPLALMQRGPIVQVTIGVEQNMAQQLVAQGAQLPQPVSGVALIDTGATSTCIDEVIARQLNLPAIDVITIASASHANSKQNVYPALIEVIGIAIKFNALRAIGVPLANQGIQVLIGRDLLQHCTLFYNGMIGSFTLSI
ncbi:MAG: retroviral-like aspartic protease family protein [Chloroflexi bacterium]|nr:retroviral-like aspartic protease family protein [Chloroflexota bacterium]